MWLIPVIVSITIRLVINLPETARATVLFEEMTPEVFALQLVLCLCKWILLSSFSLRPSPCPVAPALE